MNILRATQSDDRLDLLTDSGRLFIQPITGSILRVRCAIGDDAPAAPSLMILPQPRFTGGWAVTEDADSITLTTAHLRLAITRHGGAFTWSDISGSPLAREPERGGKWLRPVEINGQKGCSCRLDLVFDKDEALYGLGQHEQGILNYRGHSEFLYQHNRKVTMPVLVSTRGYALLFDSASAGAFHDDQYGSHYWSEFEDALDFYFLYGPEFDGLVSGVRRLTGRPALLPKWTYGYLQSKERYKRQSELVEIVDEYRSRGIGLDAVILDWMSWPGKLWGQKTLDPDRFPDPARLMADLRQRHARLMVSVWPKFSGGGPDEQAMRAQGGLLGDDQTYNAFDPQARALFWQQAEQGLFRHGIDGWWCDSSEPFEPDWRGPVEPEPFERMVGNTAVFKQYLDPRHINAYSLLHSQGIYEGQRAASAEKRVVNLTRSAFPGQARYGTVTWSGDVTARWETLKAQIPAGLNFTVTGSPRWTFDIGGFFVDSRRDRPDGLWFWDGAFPDGADDRGYRELYARWFQVGAFLPMMRAHGTDTPREVWRFGRPGEAAYDTLVRFIRLRYRLLPYFYSLAGWETHRDYTTLRALAFDFRHDPLVFNITDQFLCGPALLVCPVTYPMYFGPNSTPLGEQPGLNPGERTVYLPAGADWYNFWTGRRYAGGQILRTPAPLDLVPLFVRAGSILPLGPDIEYTGQKPNAPIELRLYPGRDGRFDLYDDEGDSYRYEQGEFAWTPLAWEDGAQRLTVGPRAGAYRGMPARQAFRVTLAAPGIDPSPPAGELAIEEGQAARFSPAA